MTVKVDRAGNKAWTVAWLAILPVELAQTARRALAPAGFQRLEQLTKFSAAEINQLYGIGPNVLARLRRALSASDLSFADREQKPLTLREPRKKNVILKGCE